MKASRYNILVPVPGRTEVLLFNSLYGSLTLLERDEIDRADRILRRPADRAGADPTLFAQLARQKHLVPDNVDELSILRRRKTAGIEDGNRLDLVIMPTLECNFACRYCYENHTPGVMSDDTERAICRWLSREIPRRTFALLHWFGGEPLLAYRRILSVSRHLQRVATTHDVAYAIHITTNGYLLSERRIRTLLSSGIRDFQVTLDGPRHAHDTLRVLRNGAGTFRRIFRNICRLCRADPSVKVSLRVNFNHTNLHSIPQLLRQFPASLRPQLRVVYEPIFGHPELSATSNLSSQEISSALAEYYELAAALGYDVVLAGGTLHPGKLVYCYAERKNQYIVNYTGDVYKCSVDKFAPSERLGFIDGEGQFVPDPDRWHAWFDAPLFHDECLECRYLPLCMGGCRRVRMERNQRGRHCALIAANASYLLKQIAYGAFGTLLREHASAAPKERTGASESPSRIPTGGP